MSLPELLAATVGDEDVVAEVPLGGDDRLAVTPTRTLVFRGDGLLSDESVDEYGHDVERIDVSTGRRKAKITLGYGLDGDETLSVPAKRVDDVLHPVLAGVLSASGVTGPGETVVRTFRFSELTLIVTSERLVKHVGSAVWDADFEEFHYEDITGLDFEEGTVATAVVLVHGGRSERFKAPNESARAVRETLADAVCSFHGVDSLEEFRVAAAEAEEPAADAEPSGTTDFGEGPDPLSASPAADAEADAEGPEAGDAAGAGRSTETDSASGDDGADSAETAASTAAGSASGDDPLDADPLAADASVDDAASDPLDADATEPASAAEGIDSEGAGEAASAVGAEGRSADAAGTESAAGDPVGDADAVATEADAEGPIRGGDAFDGSPFESAGVEDADLASEVAALRRTVEAQSERLDRQSALIEQLIEELRRGR
ncbi:MULTISPECIES: hypothetical protein [Halorubrum]|uniref:DUF7115 domain-containing protein n=1 Tax=Halorubrum tropicale TaxID=1765655 RepID=A0A0N0UB43_9EURY|nr:MULTISPECIES: hypothetical protein [Halorubrum]KOX98110.1 hypothetical protein AMR74_04230 [Halorubrum tropicale]TKX40960.1 hypothetical protein EXE50_16815 [Halorubrum sp. ARQ200]TKX48257.1 hypothetical protein EXE49_16645 [Halorubrum sp. ASP121]TKX57599.1 hypothetical protein EXE48_17825 [Halorubrum sp. ASP1]